MEQLAPSLTARNTRDADVAKAVRGFCHRQGADPSTTEAAIAWGLRTPGTTLPAAQAGCNRARQLLARIAQHGDQVPA